jgi:hypothetical protein
MCFKIQIAIASMVQCSPQFLGLRGVDESGSFFFLFFVGVNYRAPWRDFMGTSAMAPLKSEGLIHEK